jgi:hypothetical protein
MDNVVSARPHFFAWKKRLRQVATPQVTRQRKRRTCGAVLTGWRNASKLQRFSPIRLMGSNLPCIGHCVN